MGLFLQVPCGKKHSKSEKVKVMFPFPFIMSQTSSSSMQLGQSTTALGLRKLLELKAGKIEFILGVFASRQSSWEKLLWPHVHFVLTWKQQAPLSIHTTAQLEQQLLGMALSTRTAALLLWEKRMCPSPWQSQSVNMTRNSTLNSCLATTKKEWKKYIS